MMSADPFPEGWIQHLADTYSLEEAVVRRLSEEFLAATETTLHDYVVQTHLRYQARGLRNEVIFARLRDEIAGRRFRVETPSVRQLRRFIYG